MGFRSLHFTLKQTFGYKQRTWITLVSTISAVSLLMFAQGFIDWMVWATREGYVWNELGHFQVTKKGYRDSFDVSPEKFLIENPPVEEFKRAFPQIIWVSGELETAGLISVNDNMTGAQIVGVDLEEYVRMLDTTQIAGLVPLIRREPGQAIMGQDLMNLTEAKRNQTVIILANTLQRSQNAIEVSLGNGFQSGNQGLDSTTIRVPLQKMKKLMRTEQVFRWKIYLHDTKMTNEVYGELKNYIQKNYPEYELTPWEDLATFYKKTRDLFDIQLGTMVKLMTAIMFLGLLNIFAINIMNRRKEIATAKAVGFNNKQIFSQFLIEGLAWGLIGGGLGALVGTALCLTISHIGIPMPPAPGMTGSFTAGIRVTREITLHSFFLVFATTVLANLLPAYRAARTNMIHAFGTKLT